MQNEHSHYNGRKRDPVWQFFDKVFNGSAFRAKCRKCKQEMSPLLAKMKTHMMTYHQLQINNPTQRGIPVQHSSSSVHSTSNLKRSSSYLAPANSGALLSQSKKDRVRSMKISNTEKVALDQEIANYFYATNTPFQAIEHDQFIKMIRMLRPGYIPPNREQVEGPLLDQSFSSVNQVYLNEFKGKTVCMAMDGWSNAHNDPVLVLSLLVDGKMYLIDCVDTKESRYTTDCLVEIAEINAKKVKETFGCTVRSFVTDDYDVNMAEMRKKLVNGENILIYGCSAHLLNLLLQEMQIRTMKEDITEIIQYFLNHHIPRSLYKAAGGTLLVMPVETQWNIIADSIESYLKNWEILVKVCKDNSKVLDQEIIRKINDRTLKRTVKDYLERMKPIAVALNSVQRETTLISDAVEIWLKLKDDIKEYLTDEKDMNNFERIISVALTPAHFLSNMIDPRYQGRRLTSEQKDVAEMYVFVYFPMFLTKLMAFRGKTQPFKDYYFTKNVVETMSPLAWWLTFSSELSENELNIPKKLFTAVASSPGVERIFSNFGHVHSSIRNCLGKEKASKLLTVHKYYNK
ncbi:uncharacterized protein LOC123504116 [Portunus trituberculatus]|uniref:uncharacterized protein LOC123504116 n=1 Tax=Portunus trituberculatus TaxID=210409 RepID=UPI001E1CB131|nr:uncharacterized protein LOC123504116 [Portunus trituberculatus]